ncbi:hypothetical protein N9A56_05435 [Planktomarina temperata]|jgi:hypothetical protein|nr:hypothetical protein [Planktomarina temperata]MDP4060929.1 hypothetical protein [Rhodobacteraceae bacterium LE17]
MNKFLSLSLLGATLAIVTACSPTAYETEPVTLETDKGEVICQLYTHRSVILDRAIHMPHAMHVAEADALCRAEGERRMKK